MTKDDIKIVDGYYIVHKKKKNKIDINEFRKVSLDYAVKNTEIYNKDNKDGDVVYLFIPSENIIPRITSQKLIQLLFSKLHQYQTQIDEVEGIMDLMEDARGTLCRASDKWDEAEETTLNLFYENNNMEDEE